MDLSLFELVGLVATLLGIVASVIAIIQIRRPRGRRISYGMAEQPITTPLHAAGVVQVMYDNREVLHPTVLTIRLQAGGPGDIASSDFDDRRPVKLRITAEMVALLASSDEDVTVISSPKTGLTYVAVGPRKIASGSVIEVVLLADGRSPTLEVEDDPLINVALTRWFPAGDARRARRLQALVLVTSPALTALAVIGLKHLDAPPGMIAGMTAIFAMLLSGGMFLLVTSTREAVLSTRNAWSGRGADPVYELVATRKLLADLRTEIAVGRAEVAARQAIMMVEDGRNGADQASPPGFEPRSTG